jgi:hypothetical protein
MIVQLVTKEVIPIYPKHVLIAMLPIIRNRIILRIQQPSFLLPVLIATHKLHGHLQPLIMTGSIFRFIRESTRVNGQIVPNVIHLHQIMHSTPAHLPAICNQTWIISTRVLVVINMLTVHVWDATPQVIPKELLTTIVLHSR